MEESSVSGTLSSVYVETGVSGPSPHGSDALGHGRVAGKSPCCCTVGKRPGACSEAEVCTGVHRCVCVGGEWSESKEQGGLLLARDTQKAPVCVPNMCSPHLRCQEQGLWLRHQSWRHPQGLLGRAAWRLSPVSGFLPLLTCPAGALFPDSQSGSEDKYTHSPGRPFSHAHPCQLLGRQAVLGKPAVLTPRPPRPGEPALSREP